MQGIRYQYSALYEEFTKSPELTRFRRYTKETGWILYNQNAAIKRLTDECNVAIRKSQGLGNASTVFTVTDVHLSHICEDDPSLGPKVELLTKKIRQYMKDLCRARAIVQMPDQSGVFSEHFASTPGLCVKNVFGPTGESNEYYKHPPHPDTCTLKEVEGQDSATDYFISNVKAMTRWIRKRKSDEEATRATGIPLDTIRTVMNILTSLYAPLIFTAAIAILHCISSTKVRIAVAGVLGAVLSLSVQVTVENVKRGEIFAITAAYFAITGVFIGASDCGSC